MANKNSKSSAKAKPKPARAAKPQPVPWLQPEWGHLVRRLAVTLAAACGLLALLNGAPLSTATLRAVGAFVPCLVLGRLAARVLEWRGEPVQVDPDEEAPGSPAAP